MGALRNALASIKKYLGQLNGRDRMLIGVLSVVAVMALVLVAILSSSPTKVELLPGMGPEDQTKAKDALSEADIAFEMRNGRVYVLPEKRMYAIAMLQQAGKLPANAETLFSNLLKNQNWMASKSQSDQLANAALCEFLGGVVGNFKGVERASVLIDAPEAVGMGLAYRKPTASVGILMKQGKALDKEMVDAVAALVAGAKAGLTMIDVKVIDLRNNRQFTARGEDDFSAGDYIELVSKTESRIQAKVRELIAYDPLAIVAVSAQVDNTRRKVNTEKFLPVGKGGSVSVPIDTRTTEREERSSQGTGPAEPGVSSNVQADLSRSDGGVGNATSSTDNTTEERFRVAIGSEREEIFDPRGSPTRINVMISLSREYIASLAMMRKPAAGAGGAAAAPTAPTQQEIEGVFAEEKKRLESDLTPLIRTAAIETTSSSDPRVVVSMIPVPQGLAFAGGSVAQAGLLLVGGGGGGGDGGLAGQLLSGGVVKTAVMGLLALVAMGVMLMLVRKGSRPQDLPTPEEIAGLPPVIDMKDGVVGEADESQSAMVGIELGDEEINTKRMLEQVQELVKKSPEDAAVLVKRWATSEH